MASDGEVPIEAQRMNPFQHRELFRVQKGRLQNRVQKKSPAAGSAAGKKSRKHRLSPGRSAFTRALCFHQNQSPLDPKERCLNVLSLNTRVHRARTVLPRASLGTPALLLQAAILSAKIRPVVSGR